jgi:hypothetical protein
MDKPDSVVLAPRSMAIIFGSNLADAAVSTAPPWPQTLGGVQLRLVPDSCYDASCELIAGLTYVSPTQINFVVPDASATNSFGDPIPINTRVVLVVDGQRYDDRTRILSGPGRVYIGSSWDAVDFAVFGVGYDCLFSFSQSDPGACGLSWSQGQHRGMLAAATDTSGQLITTKNPIHQGQIFTLWATGLAHGTLTGVFFGVAQNGHDLSYSSEMPYMAASWAGESPQYVGLDQINVQFPVCMNPPATSQKQYDMFLKFEGQVTTPWSTTHVVGNDIRVYVPFIVNQGDPDCSWAMSLSSSQNPSAALQSVTFRASVTYSPFAGPPTGKVTFMDGSAILGSAALTYSAGGAAQFSTSGLSVGSHSIWAEYSDDSNNARATSTTLVQVVR